jgi:hypothetical protein
MRLESPSSRHRRVHVSGNACWSLHIRMKSANSLAMCTSMGPLDVDDTLGAKQ